MLFPAASGILVERGSLLSHSAIVSRELRNTSSSWNNRINEQHKRWRYGRTRWNIWSCEKSIDIVY